MRSPSTLLIVLLVFLTAAGTVCAQHPHIDTYAEQASENGSKSFSNFDAEDIDFDSIYYFDHTNEAVQTGTDVPEIRRLDSDAWKAATEGLDYTEASPPPLEQAEPKELRSQAWVSFLVYGVLVVLALVLVYLAIQRWGQIDPRPRAAAEAPDPEEIEHLEDLDLASLAEAARKRGQWAEALRWQFLALLQGMAEKGWIEWTRDKTNRHYQRELRRNAGQEWGRAFRAVAQAFERYRYGGLHLDQRAYEAVLPELQRLDRHVRQQKRGNASTGMR